MTSDEFRAIRQAAGLTQTALAEYLGVSGFRTVQRYESGERKIPGPVAKLMGRLAEEAKPPDEEER
jgi:DNA-binding transcriptional regulator YiaG